MYLPNSGCFFPETAPILAVFLILIISVRTRPNDGRCENLWIACDRTKLAASGGYSRSYGKRANIAMTLTFY